MITTVVGNLRTFSTYSRSDCILYDIDATSVMMSGMVEDLWLQLPYARLHRAKLPYKNRAERRDHGIPGEVEYGEPAPFHNRIDDDPYLPHLIGLITQHAGGKATGHVENE